eukprot:CAMPEP_0185022916 /NCGR_PEP_ID=MMETSP1103-20130426/5635_1 /TAXON_ID=36769 /ORGANISM="Paraphysomonas bandaiensis, Strain Caron Lab Isolate" /LENGTH=87 /DNA_ID=CAMNT_0027555241 /DNA_START=859 /DNA_END=1119 /DNA_ORIENTATION=-
MIDHTRVEDNTECMTKYTLIDIHSSHCVYSMIVVSRQREEGEGEGVSVCVGMPIESMNHMGPCRLLGDTDTAPLLLGDEDKEAFSSM